MKYEKHTKMQIAMLAPHSNGLPGGSFTK